MARVAQVAHELAGLSDSGAARLTLCRGAVRVTQAHAGGLWEPDHDAVRLRLTRKHLHRTRSGHGLGRGHLKRCLSGVRYRQTRHGE